jgi:hypothetical protein
MSNVIPFPKKKRSPEPEPNSHSEPSFEEGEIEMAVLWPMPDGSRLVFAFKVKDVELALAAVKGDQEAFLELAEMNGFELA